MLRVLKKWYFDLPVVRKLNFSYLVVVIVPIILLAILSNKISSDIIIDKTINNSLQNLDLVTRSLEGLLNHVNDISKIVVSNNFVQELYSDSKIINTKSQFEYEYVIRTILDSIIEPRKVTRSIAIYGDNGKIIGSSVIDPEKAAYQYKNWDIFRKSLDENWGEPVLADTHRVNYEKEIPVVNCISIIKPLISTVTGKTSGYVEINIAEETVSSFYSNLKYGKTGRFFIINREGIIVSSGVKSELYTPITYQKYFEWIVGNNRSGRIFNIGGSRYLITSSAFESMNWTIVGIIPLGELIDDNNRVTALIYSIGLMCIILALISSIFISRSISMPIVRLSRSMNIAGKGGLEVRVPVDGEDEIGQLSTNFNKMVSQISSLMNQVYEEQRKKRKFELLALQAQINPHFLYNTLESVCSLAQLGRGEDVFSMVKSLGMFYRIVLSKGRNIISLREEIENVKHYLAIQKIRYSDKFDYSFKVDEDILECGIVKLSVQPIVENSIYHGIRNKRGCGFIRIEAKRDRENIVISVADNGTGFKEGEIGNIFTMDYNQSSFGLRSVDERIKLYFGQEYGIRISSEPGEGARVDICLPANRSIEKEDNV